MSNVHDGVAAAHRCGTGAGADANPGSRSAPREPQAAVGVEIEVWQAGC